MNEDLKRLMKRQLMVLLGLIVLALVIVLAVVILSRWGGGARMVPKGAEPSSVSAVSGT